MKRFFSGNRKPDNTAFSYSRSCHINQSIYSILTTIPAVIGILIINQWNKESAKKTENTESNIKDDVNEADLSEQNSKTL